MKRLALIAALLLPVMALAAEVAPAPATPKAPAAVGGDPVAAAPKKTPDDYRMAYIRAYNIVPNVYPRLREETGGLLPAEVRTKMITDLKASAPQQGVNECFIKAGFIEYVISQYEQAIDPVQLRQRTATLWAQRYSTEQLAAVEHFTQSPVFRKVTEASQSPTKKGMKAMEILRLLHAEGELSEEDLKYFLGTMASSRVGQFFSTSSSDLQNIMKQFTDAVAQSREQMLKKFVEDNALAIVHCDKPSGAA